MAGRFQTPDEQFFDANGVPLAGGLLYFYASGTSTPLATYNDSLLTIPNANPVQLDSAGRAGSIFLGFAPYKVVLTDQFGDQIWTEDPVVGQTGSLLPAQSLTINNSTILSGSAVIFINSAFTGPNTYFLPPSPLLGETHWVKCIKGDENVNNVTMNGNGFSIDSNPTYIFQFIRQSAGFSFNGTGWSVL